MDYKTLFTVLVSVFLIQAVALAQTWRQNPEEIGIRDWAMGALWMSFGSLFSAIGLYMHASGTDPFESELLRIVGSSTGTTGWYFVWLGTRRFYRKPVSGYRPVMAFLVAFTVLLGVGMLISTPLDWRVFWVSAAIAVFAALTLREFMQPHLLRSPTVLLMITMLVFTTVAWLLRSLASIDHTAHVTRYAFTDALSLYDGIVASVTLTVSMIVLTNERINQQLHHQATHDPLTGVMNRRAFYTASAPLLAALQRNPDTLTVCLLDIDHFKRFNDSHGHAAGDSVLRQFAQLARPLMREGDLFARHGGEEFVVLLHSSGSAEAQSVLQRLRRACAEQGITIEGQHIGITFSAGVCQIAGPAKVTLDALLEKADHAMYAAKETGRDRFVVAPV